jgi:hypothetical protein
MLIATGRQQAGLSGFWGFGPDPINVSLASEFPPRGRRAVARPPAGVPSPQDVEHSREQFQAHSLTPHTETWREVILFVSGS